jgi:hypothetical protein
MPHIASMGIYVVKADAMRQLLLESYPEANDFGSEVIPGAVGQGMKVQVCRLLAALLGCDVHVQHMGGHLYVHTCGLQSSLALSHERTHSRAAWLEVLQCQAVRVGLGMGWKGHVQRSVSLCLLSQGPLSSPGLASLTHGRLCVFLVHSHSFLTAVCF